MCSVPDRATILHADLDAFYASVEQRDDSRLRGRPVIVGTGVVLAASYEARALGVRTAMGGGQARALCPRAVVVEPRMSAYAEASKAVFDVFERTTPPLPTGTKVRIEPIELAEAETSTLAERLKPVIGAVRGLPPDLAEQHDHYLHGQPKR